MPGGTSRPLAWARRRLKERGSERDHGLSERRVIAISLCGRLSETREVVELAWDEFAVAPSLEAYQRLCEHARTEGTSRSWRGRALAVLNAPPRNGDSAPLAYGYRPPGHSTLTYVLLREGDEEATWRVALQGGCADGRWLELAPAPGVHPLSRRCPGVLSADRSHGGTHQAGRLRPRAEPAG